MYCKYTRVFSECSKSAAEWQLMFTIHVTNTFPNVYQYLIHPDDSNVTEIANCNNFLPGLHAVRGLI